MAFRVEITAQAERDTLDILDWLISERAGRAGLRWFEGLEQAILSLAEMPLRCPVVPERQLFPFEVRHLLYGGKPHVYRIVFAVEDQTVYVLHVWHARRRHVARKQ
jgi:plasmid stabilization system protein ParE